MPSLSLKPRCNVAGQRDEKANFGLSKGEQLANVRQTNPPDLGILRRCPERLTLQAARREWASSAQGYLVAVIQAVDGLRELFQADRETTPEADEAVASHVVSACSNLNDWLRSGHAPRGFAKAGGELGAAAGVYRNAAVAFKSLAEVDGDQREATLERMCHASGTR